MVNTFRSTLVIAIFQSISLVADSALAAVTVDSYIKNGLVAHWDGLTSLTTSAWTDLSGSHTFNFTGSVTVGENGGVSFPGATSTYGTLSAASTTATIGKAKNGRFEIVAAIPNKANQILLQAPEACGPVMSCYLSSGKWILIAANKTSYAAPLVESCMDGSPHTFSIGYNADSCPRPVSVFEDGVEAESSGLSDFWGTQGTETILGGRCAKSGNPFSGTVYAIRVYNRDLSATELKINSNIDRIRYENADGDSLAWPTGVKFEDGSIKCQVDVSTSEGSVTVNGSSSVWGMMGQTLTLVATVPAGKRFGYWSGDVSCIANGDLGKATAELTVCGPASIVPVFISADFRTSQDYVQDGLMMMLDGIENRGVNLPHDPAAAVWTDLSGNGGDAWFTNTGKTGAGWHDGKFFSTGTGTTYASNAGIGYYVPWSLVDHINAGGEYTIQGLTHFVVLNAGGGAIFQINATSGADGKVYIQNGGGRWRHRNASNSDMYNFYAQGVTVTNTLTYVYSGKTHFSQYKNADLYMCVTNQTHGLSTYQMTDNLGMTSSTHDWTSGIDVFAIRVYNRALTPREIAMNVRTDDERFFGSNVTYIVEVKSIRGTPTPSCGIARMEKNSGFSIASGEIAVTDIERYRLTGWTWIPDHGDAVSGAGTSPSVTVTDDGIFEWHWMHEYKIADIWREAGSSVTLNAVPPEGKKFIGWSGFLPENVDKESASITFTADRAYTPEACYIDTGHVATTATFSGSGKLLDWNDPANWGGSVPGEGDEVIVNGAGTDATSVVIDSRLPVFSSVLVKNATIVFKGWNNPLRATGDVVISTQGKLTSTNGTSDVKSEQSRVWVICDNFTMQNSGCEVNVSAKGYRSVGAGTGVNTPVEPEDGRPWSLGCNGGSHGGLGGWYHYNGNHVPPTYDDVEHPRLCGSSGGANGSSIGGAGGGAVLIEASGTVTVAGSGILANGGGGNGSAYYGGGAGGSIDIICNTITGSGTISVNGGTQSGWGGAGAGGRIAIHYNVAAQRELARPTLNFQSRPSSGNNNGYGFEPNTIGGEHGTLWLPDGQLLNSDNLNVSARLYTADNRLELDHLVMNNRSRLELPADGFRLVVNGDVTINGASGLVLGGERLQRIQCDTDCCVGLPRIGGDAAVSATIGGNLTLNSNYAEVILFARSTGDLLDAEGNPSGGFLNVGRKLTIKDKCRVIPVSCGTNGISCAITVGSLDLQTGGQFNATRYGFFGGVGEGWYHLPGQDFRGITAAGARRPFGGYSAGSHGGYGGITGTWTEDLLYDDVEHPVLPGAGGNASDDTGKTCCGGFGGGVIHVTVRKTAQIDGTMIARGTVGKGNGHSPAAAGGSIYLHANKLKVGDGAVISVKGGDGAGSGGDGGGGRIAIWRAIDLPGGVNTVTLTNTICTAAAGTRNADPGTPGTVFLGQLPIEGTVLILR